MVAALTTAAVINHSFSPPEKGVSWMDFAPHYREFKRGTSRTSLNASQLKQVSDFNAFALAMAEQMRQESQCQTTSNNSEPSSTDSSETH